jgi:hypothetical protein
MVEVTRLPVDPTPSRIHYDHSRLLTDLRIALQLCATTSKRTRATCRVPDGTDCDSHVGIFDGPGFIAEVDFVYAGKPEIAAAAATLGHAFTSAAQR